MHHSDIFGDASSLIDLTPLIDVVFVVLIMFIVVAPLLELDSIQLASGLKEKSVSAIREDAIDTIRVYADNSIGYCGKKISIEQLRGVLQSLYSKNPHATPQVIHDKRAQFGTYQEVKNAVEQAGFMQMDIVLQPS